MLAIAPSKLSMRQQRGASGSATAAPLTPKGQNLLLVGRAAVPSMKPRGSPVSSCPSRRATSRTLAAHLHVQRQDPNRSSVMPVYEIASGPTKVAKDEVHVFNDNRVMRRYTQG